MSYCIVLGRLAIFFICFFSPRLHSFRSTNFPAFCTSSERHAIYRLASTSKASSLFSENELQKLKAELIESCDEYKRVQKQLWSDVSDAATAATAAQHLVLELDQARNKTISLIENLANLNANPTTMPLECWQNQSKNNNSAPIKAKAELLDGFWQLRFTTARDATFRPGRRGPAITSQYINSSEGVLSNIIAFPKNEGKVQRIVVEVYGRERNFDTNEMDCDDDVDGTPLRNRLHLQFRKVIFHRRSRVGLTKLVLPFPTFGWLKAPRLFFSSARLTLFGTKTAQQSEPAPPTTAVIEEKEQEEKEEKEEKDVIKIPSKNKKKSNSKQFFDILYLDDDLRMHRTGRGDYFVQTKLYDVWDPEVGWKQISML